MSDFKYNPITNKLDLVGDGSPGGPGGSFSNGIGEVSTGVYGIKGEITFATELGLTQDFSVHVKDRILDRKFVFLYANVGADSKVPLFSVRNETGNDLDDVKMDLFVGFDNAPNLTTSAGRTIFGSYNYQAATSGAGATAEEFTTIVGNNNINSIDNYYGYNTIVGNNNLNAASGSGYQTVVGSENFPSTVSIGDDNVILGSYNGLSLNSLGGYCTFIGDYNAYGSTGDWGLGNFIAGPCAFFLDDAGLYNTLLGYGVLNNCSTIGDRNALFGMAAAQNAVDLADRNTIIGHLAYGNGKGGLGQATVVGEYAGRHAADAFNSTIIGRQAGYRFGGSNNTAIGTNAGRPVLFTSGGELLTGNNNTFVGTNSGYANTAAGYSNMIVLGDYYGDVDGAAFLSATTDLYLISNTDVSEVKLKLPNIYATPGQVLTDTLGDGNLSWTTPAPSGITSRYHNFLLEEVVTTTEKIARYNKAISGFGYLPIKTASTLKSILTTLGSGNRQSWATTGGTITVRVKENDANNASAITEFTGTTIWSSDAVYTNESLLYGILYEFTDLNIPLSPDKLYIITVQINGGSMVAATNYFVRAEIE